MARWEEISPAEVMVDIGSGATDSDVRLKHGLSESELTLLYERLVAEGMMTPAELEARKTRAQDEPDGAVMGAAQPEHRDVSDLEQWQAARSRRARLGIVLGLVLVLPAPVLAVAVLDAMGLAALCIIGGLLLYVWGCGQWAVRKGYHGRWGLLGLVPPFLGLLALALMKDRSGTTGPEYEGTQSAAVRAFVPILILGVILAVGAPYYVAKKRTRCDRAAVWDLNRLANALEGLRQEAPAGTAPWEKLDEHSLRYLVGPFYGWGGTNRKCDVRIRILRGRGEIQACALKGSTSHEGYGTRYLYRVKLSDGTELPTTCGPCAGAAYGGPGATCHAETMLNPDGTLRQPPGAPCQEHQ
ncbi:MAG: hypothetical protein AB1646_09535 [Thermodesulfobacteriota bacterium]